MTASDGSVGQMVKVVDHGPASIRWNLVILGDGYQASELSKYHTDVQNLIDDFYSTAPYDELWCGINVYRIDVTSTDSGADDPTDCTGGTGATPKTFFDAKFCSVWEGKRLARLLTVDSALALSTATAKLPERDQVLVVVNSSKYGGAGGQVATCSTHGSASEIAIHEIGHSAFGLADEYEGSNAAPTTEPPKPNVTINTNRATNKWGDLILAATPMPSSCYSDCTTCTPPTTAPAAGAVGTYEGGFHAHCGVFRPLPNCFMRDYSPFCPVCARVIRQVLQPFQPPESITLTTPSVNFGGVPEGLGGTGVTAHRAIVFEYTSCRELTFAITSGPTWGFGTPFGTSVTVGAAKYTPTAKARLWLAYTSTTAGASANGTVTVSCAETGQSWVINISAGTVNRPKSAVALVLDRSGSMAEDAGDGTTKVQKLRQAVKVFLEAMLPGDGVGIVTFDHVVTRLMNVTDVGPTSTGAGRTTAINHIDSPNLDPAGATSIGGGVVEGKKTIDDAQAIASPPYDVRAIVVLTDGIENTAPMLASVGSSITANSFAIGLGLPYNISTAALNTLTQGTNGYLLVTGAMASSQQTLLKKYFLQVLAGVTNASVILDPQGDLTPRIEHRIPFEVTEADYGIEAFVLTPHPEALDVQLETPDGSRVDESGAAALPTAELVVADSVTFYRVALPVLPERPDGTHEGTWCVVLSIRREWWDKLAEMMERAEAPGTLPYDVVVHSYSSLELSAVAVQPSFEPGSTVSLLASLREYQVAVADRAIVWAEITRPDQGNITVELKDNGQEQYAGSFVTTVTGVYQIRVRARGETLAGTPFTREQRLTAVARPAGEGTPTTTNLDTLGRMLCCLLDREGMDPFWERVDEWGFDVEQWRKCLHLGCREFENPTPKH
jgi:hypothetical protein